MVANRNNNINAKIVVKYHIMNVLERWATVGGRRSGATREGTALRARRSAFSDEEGEREEQ